MNTQIINEYRDATKATINEPMPRPIPVIEVSPKLTQCAVAFGAIKTSTGSSTIMNANPNQDVYIQSITYCIIKDAACDKADGSTSLTFVQNGATMFVSIPVIALTAQSQSINITFPNPIKIDRNSAINFGNDSFAAGKFIRHGVVSVIIDEYSKA